MANSIHPKMDRLNRAKQFMPFDALKGFREALEEKEREAEAEAEKEYFGRDKKFIPGERESFP